MALGPAPPGAPVGPLSHLTVLDLTEAVAGPYCTKLLAGFGARVIKVERPGTGDPQRAAGPFAGGAPGPDRSLSFLWLNTAKESVALDLAGERGRAILLGLLARAQVLVESFPAGGLECLGLDPGRLRAANPAAVVTRVSSFGQSGPYRDYAATDAVLYAMSGGMVATGDPDRAPLASGPAIAQYTAGMHAYLGTLLALYGMAVGTAAEGAAPRVDVSMQESALDNVEIALAEHLHLGHTARRTGDAHAMVPWQSFPCRDGHAAIIGGPVRRWLPAVEMFEEPRLGEEPFRHMGGRIKHRRDFESLIRPWLARHDKVDIYREGQRRGLAFGYLATLGEARRSPQHQARGFFAEAPAHPEVGAQEHCGPPFSFGPGSWRMGRAPRLGEHTEGVLQDLLAASAADLDRWRREGAIG